jgi:hypothetical protein
VYSEPVCRAIRAFMRFREEEDEKLSLEERHAFSVALQILILEPMLRAQADEH